MTRDRIFCPACRKKIATTWWAPGYPGLWSHKNSDGKKCRRYVRWSERLGRWV